MIGFSRRLTLFLCLAIVWGLVVPVARAGTVALPRTGQTKCYDSAGAEIDCAGTGQDGMFRSGVAWPDPRFTDNGDGTMTDNLTGLVWAGNGELSGWRTWQQALNFIKFMNEGAEENFGFTDWRLPNILEMESLSNRGTSDFVQWLKDQGFINVYGTNGRNFYWTSTTNKGVAYRSSAYIYNILSDHAHAFEKTTRMYVWPVRGGQADQADPGFPANIPKTGQVKCYNEAGAEMDCAGTGQDGELRWGVAWPEPRLTDNGDGSVTDNLTGLVWKGAPSAESMTWSQALDYAASFNPASAGRLGPAQGDFDNDWRLCDENQGESLCTYGDESLTCGGQTCLEYASPCQTGTTFTYPGMTGYAMGLLFVDWPYSPQNECEKITDCGRAWLVKNPADMSLVAAWLSRLEEIITSEEGVRNEFEAGNSMGLLALDYVLEKLESLISEVKANIGNTPLPKTHADLTVSSLEEALAKDREAWAKAEANQLSEAAALLGEAAISKGLARGLFNKFK